MLPSTPRILVVGATGMLGKPVAQQLYADGFTVRILSRSPERAAAAFGDGFEICKGDVEDPASLQEALVDCDGVHINVKGGPKPADFERLEYGGTAAVVQAALMRGVQQITYLSAYTIEAKNALSPESKAKFKAEEAIRASGIPYILFRASWFMESLPLFIQKRRALILGRQPHPLHWVAAADYARMVSRSYQTTAALNKALYIYGPRALPMKEAAQIYCQIARPEIRVAATPLWVIWLLGKLTRSADLQSMADLMGYYDRIGEAGDPGEANALLGAPQTTLEEWSEVQRDADQNSRGSL